MTRAEWCLRRLAVRLAGQGPRTSAPLARFGSGLRELRHETGGKFSTFAPRRVDAIQPTWTSEWPRAAAAEPDRCAYILSGGGLYDGDGVIYERTTRCAIRESLDFTPTPASRHPAMGRPRLHPPHILPGTSVFVGGLGGRTFYHFLVETLPQIAWLQPEIDRCDRLIVQGYIEPQKEAWLRRAGVRVPIVWLQPLDHLICPELVFCPRLVAHYQPNPWATATLQRLVGARPASVPARSRFIWADRRSSHVRIVPWESDLVARLPAPWNPVDFSALTPQQTIDLCAECTGFAGFHGAAFSNLAFCPPGTRVFEFYPEPKESWYPALSDCVGHRHCVASTSIGLDAILPLLSAAVAEVLPNL